MKNGIKYRILLVSILSAVSVRMSAVIDFVSVDPLWEAAVLTGSKKVMEQYDTQNKKLLEMATLQNTMALHFKRKYNNYLKDASSFAEAYRAGTVLTAEAVRTLRDLIDLKKVMMRNPEGIAATLAMNNLYMETITEFIKTFHMLKFSVSTEGEFNMLTGRERVEMIWALCDRMEELNAKVRKLILSVAYYRVNALCAFYTRGLFDRHQGDIAENCLERWNRIQDAVRIMN